MKDHGKKRNRKQRLKCQVGQSVDHHGNVRSDVAPYRLGKKENRERTASSANFHVRDF